MLLGGVQEIWPSSRAQRYGTSSYFRRVFSPRRGYSGVRVSVLLLISLATFSNYLRHTEDAGHYAGTSPIVCAVGLTWHNPILWAISAANRTNVRHPFYCTSRSGTEQVPFETVCYYRAFSLPCHPTPPPPRNAVGCVLFKLRFVAYDNFLATKNLQADMAMADLLANDGVRVGFNSNRNFRAPLAGRGGVLDGTMREIWEIVLGGITEHLSLKT